MIDILLSTYNGEKYIEEQIKSLLNQTYSNWFLKIRDDCSTDKTLDILYKYAEIYKDKIEIIDNEGRNLGATQSFAKLIEKSTSDYIMLCDQDDVWFNNKIELSLNSIQQKENENLPNTPILFFSDLVVVDDDLYIINDSFWNYQKLKPKICSNYKKLLALNVVTGCTIILNRVSKQYILPIPEFLKSHDGWIAVNIAYYGKCYYTNEPTMYYRQHTSNAFGAREINASYFRSKIGLSYFNHLIKKTKTFSFKVNWVQISIYQLHFAILRLLK
jgi:glycosyltransferase involved in cell wall biosynthesis